MKGLIFAFLTAVVGSVATASCVMINEIFLAKCIFICAMAFVGLIIIADFAAFVKNRQN